MEDSFLLYDCVPKDTFGRKGQMQVVRTTLIESGEGSSCWVQYLERSNPSPLSFAGAGIAFSFLLSFPAPHEFWRCSIFGANCSLHPCVPVQAVYVSYSSYVLVVYGGTRRSTPQLLATKRRKLLPVVDIIMMGSGACGEQG